VQPAAIMQASLPPLKKKVIQKIFEQAWKEKGTKISPHALDLSVELLRLFVSEVMSRIIQEADLSNVEEIDIAEFEKILPQLLLDF